MEGVLEWALRVVVIKMLSISNTTMTLRFEST